MVRKLQLTIGSLWLVGVLGACGPSETEPAVTVTKTVESSAAAVPSFNAEQQEVLEGIAEVYNDQVCSSLRDGVDVSDSVASASRGVSMFTVAEHAKLHAAAIERDCPEFDYLVAGLDR